MMAPSIPWTPADGVPGAYRVGHSTPPHPADGLTAHICIGDGAYMTIANPQSYDEGGIVWRLTYGDTHNVRHAATSILTSFDYLLSGNITMQEATERLRLLRRAHASLVRGAA
jgi:hypothetical protein